jgi:tetratricopeptide (TPR) repeat protein
MFRRLFLSGLVLVLLAACQSLPVVSVDSLMKEGQDLYAQKQYDDAIRKFSDALGKDAKHWPAHLWIARSQIAKGAWSPAVASARQAWQIAPSGAEVIPVFAQALFGAGEDFLKGGKFGEALGLFGEYIRLQPGNASAYLNVARAYLGERKFADALASMLDALRTSSDGSTRQEALALLLEGSRQAFAQGDPRSVIGFLREYLKFDTANVRAWFDLGNAQWDSGERLQALDAFRRVLELNPRHEEALRFILQR